MSTGDHSQNSAKPSRAPLVQQGTVRFSEESPMAQLLKCKAAREAKGRAQIHFKYFSREQMIKYRAQQRPVTRIATAQNGRVRGITRVFHNHRLQWIATRARLNSNTYKPEQTTSYPNWQTIITGNHHNRKYGCWKV